jgi:hypothetical protein
METITVVASRSGAFGLTETEMLIGGAVLFALIAWAVLSRIKHLGGKPHA